MCIMFKTARGISMNMRLLPSCHILASCKSLLEHLVHIQAVFLPKKDLVFGKKKQKTN